MKSYVNRVPNTIEPELLIFYEIKKNKTKITEKDKNMIKLSDFQSYLKV